MTDAEVRADALVKNLKKPRPDLFEGMGWWWLWPRTDYVRHSHWFVEQPVPFSHQHHVAGLGIDCRFCHTTVETAADASPLRSAAMPTRAFPAHDPPKAERSDRPTPREIELKLAVPDGSVDAVQAHLRAANPESAPRHHEVTTYFDTPDRVLERGGLSLRVRAAGAGRIQTLKADRQDSVVADRAEWEWPVEQDEPDLRLAEQILTERGLPQKLDLEPVFRTEVDRPGHNQTLGG